MAIPSSPVHRLNDANPALNQSGGTPHHDAYAIDPLLGHLTDQWGTGWAVAQLSDLGRVVGDPQTERLARDANRHHPELVTFDPFGHRVDEVEFHPSYHDLMALAFGHGVHSLAWTGEGANPHLARAMLSYLWNQAENGVGCPTAMTYGAPIPFRTVPDLWAQWRDKVLAADYDPRPVPMEDKAAVTIGMAMTEKQGGSDLRAIRTTATPTGPAGPGEWYVIDGHKWFTSVPMSDGFFTLAQTAEGPSCLFFPRWLPDGAVNGMRIQRLKDKVGNRSNASSEIELESCLGILVGEPGRGIKTIIQQGHLTRMDFAVGSAGMMRAALTHTAHHVSHRRAFDRTLVDLPMMRAVLADLEVEVEAATLLGLRVALAYDLAEVDPMEELFGRVATPLAKYWNCRRAIRVVAEALECHGGNGFIEEGPMARLYREAPLNNIWEGTSNMMCLDVLRSFERLPETVDALLHVLRQPAGHDAAFDAAVDDVEKTLRDTEDLEPRARWLADRLATLLAGALLIEQAPNDVANLWLRTRVGSPTATLTGIAANGPGVDTLVDRALIA